MQNGLVHDSAYQNSEIAKVSDRYLLPLTEDKVINDRHECKCYIASLHARTV